MPRRLEKTPASTMTASRGPYPAEPLGTMLQPGNAGSNNVANDQRAGARSSIVVAPEPRGHPVRRPRPGGNRGRWVTGREITPGSPG